MGKGCERQRFGAFLQLSADGGNPLEQHFASARRQAFRNRSRNDQPEKSTEHDHNIEPGQNAFEPTCRQFVADVHGEERRGEQARVNVGLQPQFRGKQGNKGQLLARVVEAQQQNQSEQGPAGEITQARDRAGIPVVEPNHQRGKEKQEAQADPALFDE